MTPSTGKHSGLGAAADGELLRRFVAVRDQAAFEELIRRYGPLVTGVCRRKLACREDQEDAFQATFLSLASRASAIRKQASLASWLHGVALRVIHHMHRSNRKWRRGIERGQMREELREQQMPDALDESLLKLQLDEALDRLPARFKDAILLCDYQGHSRKEAAKLLEIPIGTLATNLRRGREMLRDRLAAGGAVATAAVTTALNAMTEAASPVSTELVRSTAYQSLLLLAGQTVGKAAKCGAIHIVQSLNRRMAMTRLLRLSALCTLVATVALTVPEWARSTLLYAHQRIRSGR